MKKKNIFLWISMILLMIPVLFLFKHQAHGRKYSLANAGHLVAAAADKIEVRKPQLRKNRDPSDSLMVTELMVQDQTLSPVVESNNDSTWVLPNINYVNENNLKNFFDKIPKDQFYTNFKNQYENYTYQSEFIESCSIMMKSWTCSKYDFYVKVADLIDYQKIAGKGYVSGEELTDKEDWSSYLLRPHFDPESFYSFDQAGFDQCPTAIKKCIAFLSAKNSKPQTVISQSDQIYTALYNSSFIKHKISAPVGCCAKANSQIDFDSNQNMQLNLFKKYSIFSEFDQVLNTFWDLNDVLEFTGCQNKSCSESATRNFSPDFTSAALNNTKCSDIVKMINQESPLANFEKMKSTCSKLNAVPCVNIGGKYTEFGGEYPPADTDNGYAAGPFYSSKARPGVIYSKYDYLQKAACSSYETIMSK